MKPDSSFWSSKKVLLTGHTGFKGSWLAFCLHKLGATVIGYALNPNEQQKFFHQLELASAVVDNRGDINDLWHLKEVVKNSEPEVIIHLAAQSLVRQSYKDPVETFTTNIMGVVNVLESARSVESVRVILIVTSDKCYDNVNSLHSYSESDPLGGHDPYSSSKGCAELVTRSYRDSFYGLNTRPHVGLATARAGNVIGGGDWSTDRLVPDAMRAFLAGDKLTVRFPNARRPWQHVLEPLSGYLILCEKLWADPLRFSSGWNFGPEQHGVTTVAELSQLLAASYGSGAKWNQIQKDDNLHEAELLQLDISKAKTKLGWRPYWDLETAVERTVEWYKSFDSGMDIKQITVEQLSGYNGINI